MTHTPGPWQIGEVIHNGHPSDDTAIIFLAEEGEITIKTSRAVDDAHLIAAAPDLLAALIECVDEIADDESPAAKQGRAAIFKAIGSPT